MSDDVVAFLRAAHEEIERLAGAAGGELPWTAAGSHDTAEVQDASKMTVLRGRSEVDTMHAALNDPRSALDRVQAERVILAMHDEPNTESGYGVIENQHGRVCGTCADWAPPQYRSQAYRTEAVRLWPCDTLRMLAYGHRHTVPGWREEWSPEGVTADA